MDNSSILTSDESLIPLNTSKINSFPPRTIIAVVLLLAAIIYSILTSFSVLISGDTIHGKIVVLATSSSSLLISLYIMSQQSTIPEQPYDAERGTWFGHRMSPEGDWTHIPIVIVATYSFVFTYGAVASLVSPKTNILTIPFFYVAGLIIFYFWHLAADKMEGKELHRIHMIHHREHYPQHDFYGDLSEFVQADKRSRDKPHTMLSLMNPAGNSTMKSVAHEGPIVVAIIFTIIFSSTMLGVSNITCVFTLLGYIFMAMFGSAMHMSFHERNFYLEPYAWYRELRSLHMIHHMEQKNYAMVNILLDFVFGSLLINA